MKKKLTAAQVRERTAQHIAQRERIKAEIDKELKELHLRTNIMYLLCDVVGSELMVLLPKMEKLGKTLKHSEKRKFTDFTSSLVGVKVRAEDIARNIYKIDEADHACNDSDFFQKLIELVVDRFEDNDPRLKKFMDDLMNMESKMNVFYEK